VGSIGSPCNGSIGLAVGAMVVMGWGSYGGKVDPGPVPTPSLMKPCSGGRVCNGAAVVVCICFYST
jgi:hypothetical protein